MSLEFPQQYGRKWMEWAEVIHCSPQSLRGIEAKGWLIMKGKARVDLQSSIVGSSQA